MTLFPVCIVIAVLGGAIGQLSMKAGLLALTGYTVVQMPMVLLDSPISMLLIGMGVGFYLLAMLSWIVALKHYDLSFAYPLLSIGYVLVYIGAVYWPGIQESFSVQKTLGVCLIVIGITISSQVEFPIKKKRVVCDQS